MHRAPGLDLLRAIAILWVMLFHAQLMDLLPDGNLVAAYGWMGVDLFFVLSGYLIGSQLFRPVVNGGAVDPASFYLRRALRTLPAYLAVVMLYFTVPGWREQPAIQPLWQFLTFTENLFIDLRVGRAFSHAWSLCVEEQFYLVAPLAAWWLARRPRPATVIAACCAVMAGGMALRAVIWLHDLAPLKAVADGSGNFGQKYQQWIYYPTWTRLDGLLGGMALALIAAFRPAVWTSMMNRANLIGGVGLLMLGLSFVLFADRTTFAATVLGYPLLSCAMAALVAAAASPTGHLGRRAVPGAAWVATMAYSLYLTHKEIYGIVRRTAGPALDGRPMLAFALYAAAALAGGSALYWAVERPFLKLRDRLPVRAVGAAVA